MAEKRGSLFTVRDVESAVVTYTVLGFLYIVGICLYEVRHWMERCVADVDEIGGNVPQYLIRLQLRSLSLRKEWILC